MYCESTYSCTYLVLTILFLGLSKGAIIGLNAVGLTLVYGATRGVNLAHGDVYGLTSVIAAIVVASFRGTEAHLQVLGVALFALVVALTSGIGLSLVVERVAFRPFRHQPPLVPIIGTIAISFVLYQIATLVPAPRSIPRLLPQQILLQYARPSLNLVFRIQDVLVIVVAAALVACVVVLLQRTKHGRAIQAWSQDREMAQLCGLHRTRTIQLVFTISGVLAGAAAWISTLATHEPIMSYGLESGLIALTAAVFGGIGRPGGAFISALAIGMVVATGEALRIEQWNDVAVLSLLVLVLMVRPTGLFGEEQSLGEQARHERGFVSPRSQRDRRLTQIVIILLGLGGVYPALDQIGGFHQHIQLISMFFYVMLALGLSITLGFAGVLNLGYAACFALGAYVTAVLTTADLRFSVLFPRVESFPLVLAISVGATAIFGLFVAYVTRRMHSGYVAIVALACGRIFQRLCYNLRPWTGGRDGIAVIPPPRLFNYVAQTPIARYYVVLVALALVWFISHRLQSSRQGRAWRALSNDELAATSCGIPVAQQRRRAIVIGAMIAGLAGALYASTISFVDPSRADFLLTALVLAMVVVGNAGNLAGAVVAALGIATLDQVAIPQIGAWIAQHADTPGWRWALAVDIRALNFLTFGAVLYGALWLRARYRPLQDEPT